MRVRQRNFGPLTGLLLLVAFAGAASADAQSEYKAAPGLLKVSSPVAEARNEMTAGLHHWMRWNAGKAAAHFRRALELDPRLGVARAYLASVTGEASASSELSRAAVDAAGASAAEVLVVRALIEDDAGRAATARTLWRAAAELLPDDAGFALEAAWSVPPAARPAAVRKVIERFPDYAPAHVRLAFALTPSAFQPITEADGSEALGAAQRAVELEPDDATAHALVGHVLERLGRHAEAVPHLTRATAAAPAPQWAFNLLAEIAMRERRYADARQFLQQAASASASRGSARTFRRSAALMRVHQGQLAEGLRELEQVAHEAEAAGAPLGAATALRIAAVLQAAADAKSGAAVNRKLDEAWRLDPRTFPHDDWATLAYALTGQPELTRKAAESYAEARQDDQSAGAREAVHRLQGLTAVAEGRHAEALEHFRQGGANPIAQLGMYEAYRALGRRQEAEAELNELLTRSNVPVGSVAVPIAKLRAKRR